MLFHAVEGFHAPLTQPELAVQHLAAAAGQLSSLCLVIGQDSLQGGTCYHGLQTEGACAAASLSDHVAVSVQNCRTIAASHYA